jgi:hypothetical protein
MSNLLKEAIIDAKAVRATALANARLALEEAFTPKLQSMLSAKLKQEMADEMPVEEPAMDAVPAEEVPMDALPPEAPVAQEPALPVGDEAPVVPGVPVEDEIPVAEDTVLGAGNPDPVVQTDELTETEKSWEDAKAKGAAKTEDPQGPSKELAKGPGKADKNLTETEKAWQDAKAPGAAKTEDPQGPKNEFSKGPGKADKNLTEEETLDETSLEAVLKELEAEVSGDEGEVEFNFGDDKELAEGEKGVNPFAKKDDDKEEKKEKEECDEVINLDEVLKSLEEEAKEEDEKDEEKEELKEQVTKLSKQMAEYEKAFKYLRTQLNETNLLNAKLLYTNKLFKAHGLNNDQKLKIVESMDRTKSVREVKIVYSTLAESLNFGAKKAANKVAVKTITEGLASKPVASTKPSDAKVAEAKKVLEEGAEMAARFQKLAGIKKKVVL